MSGLNYDLNGITERGVDQTEVCASLRAKPGSNTSDIKRSVPRLEC